MKKLDMSKPRVLRFSEANMNNGVTVLKNIGDVEKVLGMPTVERPVYFSTEEGDEKMLAPNHKAIVVGGKIVSVQRNSYNLVTNKELVMPILDRISNTSNAWEIDSRHSYVSDTRMRLAIRFPELSFKPSDGLPINMMLNISNSYDSTEKIKMAWGLLRLVCTNGMGVYEALAQNKRKHTVNFNVDEVSASIVEAYESMPLIQSRLNLLAQESFSVDDSIRDEVENLFGKRAVGYLDLQNAENPIQTRWDYYNVLTYYISHFLHIKQRGLYQARASELFGV